MAFRLDPELERYTTPRQWELLQAWETHGTEKQAADVLGVNKNAISQAWRAVKKKAAIRGYAPDEGVIKTTPEGFHIKGTSTLYDADGEQVMQWVKTGQDQEQQDEAIQAAIAGFADVVPRAKPRKAASKDYVSDLLAAYPIGDHHLGMLSWQPETGADWDIDLGEKTLIGAMDHLVDTAPHAETALIAFLGDYMHYDSYSVSTPKSHNQLDSDTRFPKLVRVAIRSMRYLIERALDKHKTVNVIVEAGNHDVASSVFLRECLYNIYENESRVVVDDAPGHFHYFRFGSVFIGTHHGDTVRIGGRGTKLGDRLPLIMAADRPEDWGSSTHRYWWTGHIHHDRVVDHTGCRVESFRVLAPGDAWHNENGYRAARDMKAVVLHKDHGEVARHVVNPDMLL